jgi:hypothetical protein
MLMSQQGLILNGHPTSAGCAPTAISMITAYWHFADVRYPVLSAQELLDANARQGQFTRNGMRPQDAQDELAAHGYTAQEWINVAPYALGQHVAYAPVLTPVILRGVYHSIVVVSMTDHVVYLDPWDGQSHSVTHQAFLRMWSCRCLMTVTPSRY